MVPRRSSSFVRSHAIAKAEWRVSLVLRAIAVAGFAALSMPSDGMAQFCFRGRPPPECKSQALTEFMLGARFTEAQPLPRTFLSRVRSSVDWSTPRRDRALAALSSQG